MNKYLKISKEISDKSEKYFGLKLVSVLLYGSSLNKEDIPNDIDIIIIISGVETSNDIKFIQNQIETYDVPMDIQIINIEDLSPDTFSHDTHGQFFISFLKKSFVLYGHNPFLNIFPEYNKQLISVIQKAQYYYFRAKKIQANKDINEINVDFHRKKIQLMLIDFWLIYKGTVISRYNNNDLIKSLDVLTDFKKNKNQEDFITGVIKDIDWIGIFSIYKDLYLCMLNKLLKKVSITDNYIEGIYTKLYSIKSKKLMIIASGFPNDYTKEDVTEFLNINNYDVCTFHYNATGKSNGDQFRNPVIDLNIISQYYSSKYEEINIIGNSYGGYACLGVDIEKIKNLNKIIAISPVINFSEVVGIQTLPKYLFDKDKYWYHFDPQGFTQFIETSKIHSINYSDKIYVIHGDKDEQIPYNQVENFCKDNNISLKKIENAGHLSLNRITKEYLDLLGSLI